MPWAATISNIRFLLDWLPWMRLPEGGIGGLHAVGGQPELLHAGIHVRLVVVTDEDGLVVAVDTSLLCLVVSFY